MSTIKQDYTIAIALDAGFSGTKVCVNGVELFNEADEIVEITGKQNLGGMRKEGYLSINYIPGQTHLVGAQARALLMQPEYKKVYESKKSMMESFDKFTTQDANIHIMACIALALIKYSNYTKENHIKPEFDLDRDLDENSLFTIYLIMGYPHDIYERVFQAVQASLSAPQHFSIEVGDETYEMNFQIPSENIMAYSQAIAAYNGMIMDDDGNVDYNSPHLGKLPALLLDGGQKTMGKFVLTENFQIESAESNTDYAMNNVYEKVAAELRDVYGRRDIETYNIQEILTQKGGKLNYIDDAEDNVKSVDVNEITKKYTQEMCEQLMDYLNKKHNNLLDIGEIAVAGGTGAAYYEGIQNYIKQHRSLLSDNLYLINYKFNGKPIEPVYAVVVGLYKVLRHSLLGKKEE